MLNIVLPAKAFASFLEEQQEWRIQAGAYGIWIGNSLSEAKLSAGVKVSAGCNDGENKETGRS